MANLQKLVGYLDGLLSIGEIVDYPNAMNGLQLANNGKVSRVGAAVDACLPVIEAAAAAGVDLLLVHHGMFWLGAQPIVGGYYEKLRRAMEGNLAIYSAHLPLDVHEDLGNNALLARALGVGAVAPFMEWKGMHLGLRASGEWQRDVLQEKLSVAVGGRVHLCCGGPEVVREVGIVTGGAGAEINQAAAEGVDTLITGEGPHWSYTAAEELGLNLLYGGHYATEIFGVKALAEHIAKREDLEWDFIDHPTGL